MGQGLTCVRENGREGEREGLSWSLQRLPARVQQALRVDACMMLGGSWHCVWKCVSWVIRHFGTHSWGTWTWHLQTHWGVEPALHADKK